MTQEVVDEVLLFDEKENAPNSVFICDGNSDTDHDKFECDETSKECTTVIHNATQVDDTKNNKNDNSMHSNDSKSELVPNSVDDTKNNDNDNDNDNNLTHLNNSKK